MKKIIVIVFGLAVFVVVGYVFVYNFTDIFIPHYRASEFPDPYYRELAEQCDQNNLGCCLASVSLMQAEGFTVSVDRQCPEGYDRDMMKCVSSYEWCAPVE